MGTRSRIGLRLPDDSILSVYCHWDGYPEYVGIKLVENFNTHDKVAELIDGGNMSSVWTDEGWGRDETRELSPLYYTERGESIDDNLPLKHDNIGEYLKSGKESDTEFVYIFNGEWTCYNVRSWEGSPNVETIPEVSNAN